MLPVFATAYLIVWFFVGAERFIGAQVRWLIPDEYYRYGMGIALALAIVFLVGLLMHAWLFREIVGRAERVLSQNPAAALDLRRAARPARPVRKARRRTAMQVVSVALPGSGMRLLGFVTRTDFSDLPEGIGRDGVVAVYLPMSYTIGGYTVFLPSASVTPVDMSREEAMKFVVTAGIRSSAERHAAKV